MSLLIPPPSDKQALFLTSTHKYTAYGGARGGGKSWAMRTKLVLLAINYPGIQILLLRRTLGQLRENHLTPLRRQLKDIASYNVTEKVFTFYNSSRIRLGYCDKEDDVLQYQGQAYEVIGLEEATHFTEKQFQALTESNRISGLMDTPGFAPRMYFTCNPGGVGHGWVKRLFIDRQYIGAEDPDNYTFIKSLVYDNHFLMRHNPEYVQTLEALPAKRRRAMLLGEWDAYEGQYFEDFITHPVPDAVISTGMTDTDLIRQRRYTHVIPPFEIPEEWRIYRSFDWGYSRPFSCGWWAVDYDGRAYRILEWYGCGQKPDKGLRLTPDKVFGKISSLEQSHRWLMGKRIIGVADPSIFDASRGESVAESGAKHGVFFSPGDNKRIPGWLQVRSRLEFDEHGYPMMYVFDTCSHFIRTIPTLVYDNNTPEDLDTDGEDHIADETRYFCMSRPIKPRQKVSSDLPASFTDPLNITERYQRYVR